jgi:hypothetical protein
MNTYTGSGALAPFIQSLCTTWRRVLIVAPLSFYLGYLLSGRLSGTRNWVGRFGEEMSGSLAGIRTPYRSTCGLVTLLTTLTHTEAAGSSYKAQTSVLCTRCSPQLVRPVRRATFLIFSIVTSLGGEGGQNVNPALWVVPSKIGIPAFRQVTWTEVRVFKRWYLLIDDTVIFLTL